MYRRRNYCLRVKVFAFGSKGPGFESPLGGNSCLLGHVSALGGALDQSGRYTTYNNQIPTITGNEIEKNMSEIESFGFH